MPPSHDLLSFEPTMLKGDEASLKTSHPGAVLLQVLCTKDGPAQRAEVSARYLVAASMAREQMSSSVTSFSSNILVANCQNLS